MSSREAVNTVPIFESLVFSLPVTFQFTGKLPVSLLGIPINAQLRIPEKFSAL